MTWAVALRTTQRQALIFAAAFLALGLVLDAVLGGTVDWSRRVVSVVVASGVYWVVLAWLRRRAAG